MIHHSRKPINKDSKYSKWYHFHPWAGNCGKLLWCTTIGMMVMVVVGYRIMTLATTVTVSIFQNDMESKNKNTTTVTFHLAFTTPAFTKLNQRCLESIFYFHPTAHVILHSNSEHGIHTTGSTAATEPHVLEPIRQLLERGYRIDIQPYSAAHVLQRAMTRSHSIVNVTLATEWMARIATNYSHEKYWYSNESNLLRLCLLYVDGGIYLDTDVILVRPMAPVAIPPLHNDDDDPNHVGGHVVVTDRNGLNVDNVMARDGKSFECAVMKFLTPGNRFLGHAINNFLRHYNGNDWGNNGPRVFGRTSKEKPDLLCPEPYTYTTTTASSSSFSNETTGSRSCSMQPLPSESFQPVPWRVWLTFCFDTKQSPVGTNATAIIRRPHVYAVHMNNHIFGPELEKGIYVKNSICDIVLTKFCILCT